MDRNFRLTIEYDGTNYQGWQIQPNGPSIQETIETAIQTMTHQTIRLTGSGRTDAGVHALGQVANFVCDTRISSLEFHNGLNSILPNDIVVRQCDEIPMAFHARYDAKSKLYRYIILNQPIPSAIAHRFAWWIRDPLDIVAMQHAADLLKGQHDFKAFEGAGSPRAHTIRQITLAKLSGQSPGQIQFEVKADGFLRYMVRNIMGTLVSVGRGAITPDHFKTILASRDRTQASATAPPQGLFLVSVDYAKE